MIQEVLQGVRGEQPYRELRTAFLALPVVDEPVPLQRHLEAVDLYRAARKCGLTVRSGVDCLLAATAIAHDLDLLHDDRDYEAIARVSSLRVLRLSG